MRGTLAYDANLARIDDLLRESAKRRHDVQRPRRRIALSRAKAVRSVRQLRVAVAK